MKNTYLVKDSLLDFPKVNSFEKSVERNAVVDLEFPSVYDLAVPLFIATSEELDPKIERVLKRKKTQIEPVYCSKISNATIQSHSTILTEDRYFLGDLFSNAARRNPCPNIYINEREEKVIDFEEIESSAIDESVGLFFFHGASGYGHAHFLIQTLGKIQIFKKAGIRPDKLLVQPTIKKYQKEMLEALGYPESDLLIRDPKEAMKFRELYATYTSNVMVPDLTVYDDIAARIEPSGNYPEKIYVSRGDKPFIRRFLNEDRIIETVQELGFEVIIPSKLTLEEEVNIFRQAKIVIGPLGGGIYNTVFSPPDTTVIALSDPCYMVEWATQIAGLRQHKIGLVFGNSFWSYTERVYWGTHNNFIIDTELLKESINSVL
jgi:hypothetical protein